MYKMGHFILVAVNADKNGVKGIYLLLCSDC